MGSASTRVWAALCAAASACGYPAIPRPATGDGGSGSDTGSDAALVTTVKALRMAPPADGIAVDLAHAVVVAKILGAKHGSVWVQDPGGGAYSGIQLFCSYSTGACPMTMAQLDALAIGSVVAVTGTFDAFLATGAPTGAQPVLEIESPQITATGATMTPVAIGMAASILSKSNYAPGTSDPYKGAYVLVTGALGFSAASVTAAEFAATCTDNSTPPQTGTTYFGFDATGAGSLLAIDFTFYTSLTYCLPCTGVTNPPACANPVAANDTFTTLRGIVEPGYSTSGMIYLGVSPTDDADLVR